MLSLLLLLFATTADAGELPMELLVNITEGLAEVLVEGQAEGQAEGRADGSYSGVDGVVMESAGSASYNSTTSTDSGLQFNLTRGEREGRQGEWRRVERLYCSTEVSVI